MKSIVFIPLSLGIILFSCHSNTSPNTTITTQEQTPVETQFLITNHSAGLFKMNGAWQEIAQNTYQYDFIQSYGSCIDACCDGGFIIGRNISKDKSYLDEEILAVGCITFDDDTEGEETKHQNNPDVFYSVSDNCKAWYWKDSIHYIILFSQEFKTKEGIGVGSTLEQLQEKLGPLSFYVGWLEEDPNAFQVKVSAYPAVQFIINADDYKENWEDISISESDNNIQLSDLKENTTIKRIIIINK